MLFDLKKLEKVINFLHEKGLVERTLLIILISVLSSDIDLQIVINLLPLSFFFNILIRVCF